jgi:hypothetical protein
LPESTRLEAGLNYSSNLGWGIDLLQNDLDAVRKRIDSFEHQLAQAEKPPPPPDRKVFETKAKSWVQGQAAKLRVKTGGGRFEVDFDKTSPLALLCLLVPDTVVEALVTAALADRPGPMVDADGRSEIARLRSELPELEHREEAIVRRLGEQGVTVARRADALPWIILGVRVPDTLARWVA